MSDEQRAATELSRLRAENETLRSRLEQRTRLRRWLAAVLVVLTSLAVVVATLAVWAHETVFDNDTFMETVEPGLDDPAFYSALSEQVSAEVLMALDLEERVADRLTSVDEYLSVELLDALEVGDRARRVLDRVDRPTLASLAPPIASGLEARVRSIVDGFVTSEAFRTRLPDLVRSAHQGAVALARDDPAELTLAYIEEGDVRLDLVPVITDVLRLVVAEIRDFLPDVTVPESVSGLVSGIASDRVDETRRQLSEALDARLPDDFGQVTVMTEESLGELQDVADGLDRFRWLLALLAIGLAVFTVAVSPTRRRTTIHLALGVIVGLALGLTAIRRLQDVVAEQIASADGRQAARAILTEVISSVGTAAVVIGAMAALVALAAYLAGRPVWVAELPQHGTRLSAWAAGRQDTLRIGGVAVAVATLFVTGLELLPVLLVAGGLVAFLWLIQRS